MTTKSTISLATLIMLSSVVLFFGTCVGQPTVIDHTCTELSQIPDEWIVKVQVNIKWHYAHTSHGSQLTTGLQRIGNSNPKYAVVIGGSFLPNKARALCVFDGQEHDTYITPKKYWDSEAGRQYTRDVLSHNPTINVSMWCWCCELYYYSEAHVRAYLNSMAKFEKENPGVTFVYMTGNLEPKGVQGYNSHRLNEHIRRWVMDHPEKNRVLFDFADLDSWWFNPAKQHWEQETYDWKGTDVPTRHPQWRGTGTGHTSYKHCEHKAKAVWWMMARLAGWKPVAHDSSLKVSAKPPAPSH